MPTWWIDLLGQLSPEGVVGGTIVALVALVRGIGAIMESRTTRVFKQNARSIPPSIPPSCNAEVTRENERLRSELHRLQWRVDELEAQLTEVGRDHGLTARSLTREREDCERMHTRVSELEEMLRSGASSPTHPTRAPSWHGVHVREVDDRPTPKLGTKRVRRP